MKTDIEILKDRYGNYTKVAAALGITYRHLLNLRQGIEPSKHLKLLIKHAVCEHTSGDLNQANHQ